MAAFLNDRVRLRFDGETIVRGSFALAACAAGGLALSSLLSLSCLCVFVAGACWVWVFTLMNVSVQLATPRWVLARALSIYQTATAGGFAAGSWFWGTVAEHQGTSNTLLFTAVALVGGILIGIRYPIPRQNELNLNPFNHWTPPPLSLDLKPTSGPIIIQVEYTIHEENVPQFLRVMHERRRIRLRDGASNWILTRSLEEPERWTMSYQLPTWVEYVRHNQRMTQADAAVGQHILALHAGPEPPVVRRMIERHTDWTSAYSERTPVSEIP